MVIRDWYATVMVLRRVLVDGHPGVAFRECGILRTMQYRHAMGRQEQGGVQRWIGFG